MNDKRSLLLLSALTLPLIATARVATAQGPRPGGAPRAPVQSGTAFTYQGQLKKNGVPVNNTCAVSFDLYDAASSGAHIAGQVNGTPNPVTVSTELFTVQVDFGAGTFIGDARWLQTTLQCTGDGSATVLGPLEPVTAAPFALGMVPGAVISGTVQNILTAVASTSVTVNLAAIHRGTTANP